MRSKPPDHRHHVGERDVVPLPLLESFIGGFRESEVGYPTESLLYPVISIGRRELKRTQDSQDVEQIAADLILSSFPPIEG